MCVYVFVGGIGWVGIGWVGIGWVGIGWVGVCQLVVMSARK